MSDHVRENIREALLMLVPIAIAELATVSFAARQKHAQDAGDIVAGKADQLMFASQKKPGVLGPMARGFAALAYQPGGVTALGLHACTEPHLRCPGEGRYRHHPLFGLVCEVTDGPGNKHDLDAEDDSPRR